MFFACWQFKYCKTLPWWQNWQCLIWCHQWAYKMQLIEKLQSRFNAQHSLGATVSNFFLLFLVQVKITSCHNLAQRKKTVQTVFSPLHSIFIRFTLQQFSVFTLRRAMCLLFCIVPACDNLMCSLKPCSLLCFLFYHLYFFNLSERHKFICFSIQIISVWNWKTVKNIIGWNMFVHWKRIFRVYPNVRLSTVDCIHKNTTTFELKSLCMFVTWTHFCTPLLAFVFASESVWLFWNQLSTQNN